MKWAIISNQVTKVNPKEGSIGRQNDGHWATGSLKEYPPAMNKALAGQLLANFVKQSAVPITQTEDPDDDFLTVCKERQASPTVTVAITQVRDRVVTEFKCLSRDASPKRPKPKEK